MMEVAMRILLVVPPNQFTLTRIPSLGLAWLAGYLRARTDYRIKLLDCLRLKKPTFQQWLSEIVEEEYDVVGIMMFSRDVPAVQRIAQAIKARYPRTTIVAGGAHVSALSEHTLKKLPAIDYAIPGEGEVAFYRLCQELESGRPDLAKVPALCYRENGSYKLNSQYFEQNLDSLGLPAWDLIDPRTYPHQPHGVVSRKSLTAPVFATRGCPYHCTYCGAHLVTGYPIRERSVGHVVEEIELLNRDYGVSEFHIEDDNFTLNNKYAIEFCEEILRRNRRFKFALPNGVRLNSLNPPLLTLMERAGFYSFAVGIETATPRLLKELKRGLTLEVMREKLLMIADCSNIQVVGYAFLGIPTETEEEMEATVRFLLEMPLARIGLGWCNALPGTELFKQLVAEGRVDLDTLDFSLFDVYLDCPVDITSVGIERVKQKIAEANRRFYLRPHIISGILKNIRTPEQFVNAIRTGIRRLLMPNRKDSYVSEGWYDIYSSEIVQS
jgi:magnesium-protoporphyrin IX monomethyl ester (oxidative) cyclase